MARRRNLIENFVANCLSEESTEQMKKFSAKFWNEFRRSESQESTNALHLGNGMIAAADGALGRIANSMARLAI